MSRRNAAGARHVDLPNDGLKCVHAALLMEFSPRTVADFWRRHPVPVDGTVMSAAQTIDHLWREGATTPLEHAVGVYNDLDWFLARQGRETLSFVRGALGGMGRGLFLTPRTMLAGIDPLLTNLFSTRNMRQVILDRLHVSAGKMFPGLVLRQVTSSTDGDWCTGIVMLGLQGEQGLSAPPVDAELFVAIPLQLAPCPTGLPAYEEVSVVADPRPVEQVAAGATVALREGRLLIDGKVHGKEIGFHELCARHRFDPHAYAFPDRPVVLATSDYLCGKRRRPVLREGCAYGAPVALVKMRYRTHVKAPANPLTKIIHELIDGRSPRWKKAEKLHYALLEELRARHVFLYKSGKNAISVDNRHLASKVPAKLLRNVLRAYLQEGRTHFEHRQFIDDPEIVADPANPNFALRLKRLMTILERKLPDVTLERTGRGSFALRTTCAIELREE